MGSSNSSRMGDHDVIRLADSNGLDTDGDIAQILQYLIRSGQVHIIASDRDTSSDEEYPIPPSPPRIVVNPNTDLLDKSEFNFFTREASGLVKKTGQHRQNSLVKMVSRRERGLPGSLNFTRGDRCRIMNSLLPNKRSLVTSYHSKIFCGTFSRDGNTYLTASQDKKLRLYDASHYNFKLIKTISGVNVGWSILDTAYSPDGAYVAYSSWSEALHLCSLSEKSEDQESLLLCPFDRRFCVFSLKFSASGSEILCGANDGCLYIYDRGCDRRVLRITSHEDDVNSVAFADDASQIIYSGGDDGVLKVWDRRTLSESDPYPVGLLAGHMDGITFIDPRGDGRHLISNSKDQSIKLWDVRAFSSQEAVSNTKKAVSDQSWDYRWQGIPKSLKNPRKKISGDTSLMTYCGHSVLQTLCRCRFSPVHTTGQRYIYTGCATGRVLVYDALTGKIESELNAHRSCVRDVSWHPYRSEILSSSWDGNVFKWTPNECECEDIHVVPQEEAVTVVRRSQRIKDRMRRLQAKMNRVSNNT